MNIFLNKIFIFATGVAVGSFITWKILDSQYEIVDDELDMDKKDDTVEKREDPKTTNKEIIDENKYTTYSDNKKKENSKKLLIIFFIIFFFLNQFFFIFRTFNPALAAIMICHS